MSLELRVLISRSPNGCERTWCLLRRSRAFRMNFSKCWLTRSVAMSAATKVFIYKGW